MTKKIIGWNEKSMSSFAKRIGLKIDKTYYLDNVISSLVIELRLTENITQKQLARRCKTKQPAIARLENTGVASLPFLEKIGKACGYQLKVYFEKL